SSPVSLPPAPSTALFPYTTLFRSSPAPKRPVRSSILIATFVIGPTSITMPPSQLEYPWVECPPPRTATVRWSLRARASAARTSRSEEHTSELQSLRQLVCRLLPEK